MADTLTIADSKPLPNLSIVKSEPLDQPGYLSQVGTGLWNAIKGLAQTGVELGGLATTTDPLRAADHLVALKKLVLDPQIDQAIEASKRWKAGDRSEAVGHALAAVIPGAGPAAANIGDKLGSGDLTGAAADATVLGTAMAVPHAIGPAANLAGKAVDLAGRVDLGAPAAAVKGAVKGGAGAITDMVPIRRLGVEMSVPAPVVTGAAGAAAARMMGLPAEAGAVLGATAPIIKGAYAGAKAALADRVSAAAVASLQDRTIAEGSTARPIPISPGPATGPVPSVSGALPGQFPPAPGPPGFGVAEGTTAGPIPPGAAPFLARDIPVSGALPGQFPAVPRPPVATPVLRAESNGAPALPGKTAAQMLQEELAAKRATAAAPAGGPSLDEIAQGQTGKKFAQLDAARQATVQNIFERLNAPAPEAAAPVAVPPPPEAQLPQVEQPRSRYNASGDLKSPQLRGAEILSFNIEQKAQRFAQALRQFNVSAADLSEIPPGRVPLEEIAKGATPGWGNITDDLVSKGLLKAEEVPPAQSVPRIIFQLKRLEKTKGQ